MELILGDGSLTCERPFLIAFKCPLTVASDLGGNFRICWTVIRGNVVNNPSFKALVHVCRVGENSAA